MVKVTRVIRDYTVLLTKPYPPESTQIILEDVPEIEEAWKTYFTAMWSMQESLKRQLDEFIRFVKAKAKTHKKQIIASPHCCHDERCGTCLGKYKSHYPYFQVRGENEKEWQTISTRRLESFLSQFLAPEQIEYFNNVYTLRTQLLGWYNRQAKLYHHVGLLSKEIV